MLLSVPCATAGGYKQIDLRHRKTSDAGSSSGLVKKSKSHAKRRSCEEARLTKTLKRSDINCRILNAIGLDFFSGGLENKSCQNSDKQENKARAVNKCKKIGVSNFGMASFVLRQSGIQLHNK